jgi:hypothetical protein
VIFKQVFFATTPPDTPMSSLSSTVDQPGTNTLVLTGLSREFFRLDVLEELRNLFASYGEVNQWVKLSTLSRIIIVYVFEEDAMRAKEGCIVLIRCVFGDQYVFLSASPTTALLIVYRLSFQS